MIRALKRLFTLLLLSMFSLTASAVVLEQAPLDDGDGVLSVGSAGAQVAENFQFTDSVTLTSISWWGSYDDSAPDPESFTVRIFEGDGAGNPLINSLYETTFTGLGDDSAGLADIAGGTVFQYDVSVSWLLQGGINYYLSVFSKDGGQGWYWLESPTGNDLNWSRAADGDSWTANDAALNLSFRLTADQITTNVPEPATLFLVLLPSLWLIRKFYK
ncbi:hypothetical protein ABHF54_05760 [Nitrosomonas europaea]|uniref:hypothetical protein n=1 Tax=Nitrosomonas europaea TaxID=915 RepID=UPI0032670450